MIWWPISTDYGILIVWVMLWIVPILHRRSAKCTQPGAGSDGSWRGTVHPIIAGFAVDKDTTTQHYYSLQ
jgi:hypothetical protein